MHAPVVLSGALCSGVSRALHEDNGKDNDTNVLLGLSQDALIRRSLGAGEAAN